MGIGFARAGPDEASAAPCCLPDTPVSARFLPTRRQNSSLLGQKASLLRAVGRTGSKCLIARGTLSPIRPRGSQNLMSPCIPLADRGPPCIDAQPILAGTERNGRRPVERPAIHGRADPLGLDIEELLQAGDPLIRQVRWVQSRPVREEIPAMRRFRRLAGIHRFRLSASLWPE